jgi:prepilin-type N-terminal cleavage/methylation domain-containing protein
MGPAKGLATMRKQTTTGQNGFTLSEVLVCMAVLALLAGLVHAGLAPVRERAREVHCLNNLSQIAKAIRLYRDDYGGQDPPAALTCSQLGLPAEPRLLLPYLGRSWAVFRCPSEYWGPGGPAPIARRWPLVPWDRRNPISYMWQIHPDDYPQSPVLRQFSEKVAQRQQDTPLVIDPHHGRIFYGEVRNVRFIVLRLSGRVEIRVAPRFKADWQL